MIYQETVCKVPCKTTECKHHVCHVPQNKFMGDVEYDVENFPKSGTCPYGKTWVKGKGLAE